MAGLVGAAAYAGLLATTRPFTLQADGVTAAALVVGAVAYVARVAGRGTRDTVDGGTGGEAGTSGPAIGPGPMAAQWRPYAPWILVAGAVVAWELYCFFGGARPAHPTLSSIYDIAARSQAIKAAVVLAWLGLGWALVRS